MVGTLSTFPAQSSPQLLFHSTSSLLLTVANHSISTRQETGWEMSHLHRSLNALLWSIFYEQTEKIHTYTTDSILKVPTFSQLLGKNPCHFKYFSLGKFHSLVKILIKSYLLCENIPYSQLRQDEPSSCRSDINTVQSHHLYPPCPHPAEGSSKQCMLLCAGEQSPSKWRPDLTI